jgi:hypothetical protein
LNSVHVRTRTTVHGDSDFREAREWAENVDGEGGDLDREEKRCLEPWQGEMEG